MSRVRVSTTVDRDLLAEARELHGGQTDSSLVEAGLAALVRQYRHEQVAQMYADAYEQHPADKVDDWGDLGTFLDAAGRS